jgi:hypothetical protein
MVPFKRIEWLRKYPQGTNFKLPRAWNELVLEITHQSNNFTFSIVLKEYLFNKLNVENGSSH